MNEVIFFSNFFLFLISNLTSFIPDFIFSVDRFMSQELVDNKVYEKCVCYAPALEVNRSKKKLKLIPNNPYWISGSEAFWTACMHGHKNIYLIGFDFRQYGKNQFNNIVCYTI